MSASLRRLVTSISVIASISSPVIANISSMVISVIFSQGISALPVVTIERSPSNRIVSTRLSRTIVKKMVKIENFLCNICNSHRKMVPARNIMNIHNQRIFMARNQRVLVSSLFTMERKNGLIFITGTILIISKLFNIGFPLIGEFFSLFIPLKNSYPWIAVLNTFGNGELLPPFPERE